MGCSPSPDAAETNAHDPKPGQPDVSLHLQDFDQAVRAARDSTVVRVMQLLARSQGD